MSQYDLLHRLQLFRDRGQPPGNHPQSVVDSHGVIRSTGGRTSPLTEAETSRVRRALFGPVDHAENLRFVQQELARGQREAEKRWNYDFVNDRPVNDPNRRYVWESMESRRQTPQIATLASSSDAEERSGTIINITAASALSDNIKETVQSDNIAPIEQIGNEKSEKSQGSTMSENNLPSRPNPLICPPNTKSHPSSSQGSQSTTTLSAPATACGTPHESPHAGSTKTGSQIIPTSKPEAEVCDNPTPISADRILTAAASSLASSSKSSKSCTSNQRSRSKSLHGTQKPITGMFRERKRSKSKSKIDSRSLKLQETIDPSQIAISNCTVTNQGRSAPLARSRSPTASKYTQNTTE